MKKSSLVWMLIISTLCVFAQKKPVTKRPPQRTVEFSSEIPSGRFFGTMFNDFMYIVQEPQTANTSKNTSGRNASLLRRATLGYAYQYTRNIAANIEYDGSSNLLHQAFAEIKNIAPLMDLKVGLSQTISSQNVEKIWEYRSLEATVLDKKGMTNEFDMGLTVAGRTNLRGSSFAQFGVYNGSGLAAENNKMKKFVLSVGNWFTQSSVLELYADYENVGGGKSTITGKLFYGMRTTKYTIGSEVFYRMNRKFAGTKDVVPAGGSVFGWYAMTKSLRSVVRFDVVDNDLNVSATGYREIYVNAGVDYSPIPEVRLIPNIVYVKNLKKGSGAEIADDIMVRLTTSVAFK